MKIELKTSELHQAIRNYVTSQGINIGAGKTVDISISAGRGASGQDTATVDIIDAEAIVQADTAKVPSSPSLSIGSLLSGAGAA